MSKKTSKSDPFAAREAAKYDRPIPSREFIIDYLKQRKTPASYNELTKELRLVNNDDQVALHRRIKAMIRDGQLERLRGGYFWLSGHRILIKGRVQIEKGRHSKAWVIPEDGGERILLLKPEGHAVYHGNQIVVSVVDAKVPNEEREGHLVEILEQQRIVVTGRFVHDNNVNYVIPHGKEFTQDIIIPPKREKNAKEGDIVVVEIALQSEKFAEPIGQIVEVLGHEDTPGIEIKSASRAYGLPEEWPIAVRSEIKNLTEEIPNSAKRNRLDIRELPLVTIDGEDAKDFDDAVYCEIKPGGGFQLYVAIADVSHYVQPNTALDIEAKLRGNSVYFPGYVIPMLPEILSNGLCSLKPDVDRLCMVCILSISKSGKITRYEFHEAVMRSHARLTYTKVAAMLEGKSDHLIAQYSNLMPYLQNLNNLYHVLRSARESRGAIEFETLETRIIFGKNGKISHIEPMVRNDAHRIIEECMLCANVATAQFLKKNKIPGLYRVHEGPPPDKLADLKVFLQELGLSLGGGPKPKPIDYAKLLKSIQNRSDANVIQSVLLRSLSQAVYSPDNTGHFGLAFEEYCHFTSPIRRYPDLITHRQIRMLLRGKWKAKEQSLAHTEEAQKAMVALGDHTSMTERRADDATRDAVRWLKCEYIAKHVGEAFKGIISGVTRFGFFVELKDIYIDGLVHITSLHNDYYNFDTIHHRLVGERSGVTYKLGDTVSVKVSRVAIHERKIDFELLNVPQGPGKQHKRGGKPTQGRDGKGRGRKEGARKERVSEPSKRFERKEAKKPDREETNKARTRNKQKKRRYSKEGSKGRGKDKIKSNVKKS